MAFPDQPLGLKGELRMGSAWQDITGDLYTRDPITHTRGRPYKSNAADPAACAATIRNLDGTYTPRNPEGPYYGLFNRNTPFRYTLPGGPVHLEMPGTADRATTPDTAALDITGDLDIRWEGEANWFSSETQFLIGKWGAAGNRSFYLIVRAGVLYLNTTSGGTTVDGGGFATLPAALPRHAAVRGTLDVDNGAGGFTLRLYWAPTLAGPWTQFSGDLTSSAPVSIFSGTAPLSIAPEQTDVTPPRRAVTGTVYKAEVRSGIDGTIVAAPDFTAQPVGTTSFTDSAGRAWTLAAGSAITDRIVRFEGEVPEWPPKWSTSEKDAWTPITAAGILRRLGQGAKPLASALRRRIPSYKPLAYWPMEEGASSAQASSPIAGVGPLRLSNVTWAQANTLASSGPLPVLASSTGQLPVMMGRVPAPSTSLTSWSVQWMYRLDTLPTTRWTFMRVLSTGGTVREWLIQFGSTTNGLSSRIIAKDDDGNTLATQDIATGADIFNRWQRVNFTVAQQGANVKFGIVWTDVGGDPGGVYFTLAGTIGRPTAVASPADGYASALNGLALGHLSVWPTDSTAAYVNAVDAWSGETASARMRRLTQEEGVLLTIVGDPDDTVPVGAQSPAPLLDLLRECAEADGGIFGETMAGRELKYRTRAALYNQQPALVLDYAAGHLAPPFEPIEDDTVRNEWAVQRKGGSTGTAVLDDGPLSVQDPPDGIGLVDDSKTLNLASDEQTDPVANWLLHLSTWDENRYPSVTLLLHKFPELIPAVLALSEGDKIRIVNLPKRFTGSGVVELLVDGWTETVLPRTWTITFTCSPAGPWSVGVVDEIPLRWCDTSGAQLATAATDTSATVNVLTTAGQTWTSNAYDYPWDVRVGGEVMTVAAPGRLLNTNPFFETNATGWSGQAAAVGRSTAVLHPQAVGSLLITPDGVGTSGGAVAARSDVGAIVPGATYVASMWAFSPKGWSDVRPVIDWYDATNTFLNTGLGSATALPAGQWTFVQQSLTAPANASRASVRARHGATPTAGDVWCVWGVRLTQPKASFLLDSFGRTVTGSWGVSDSGPSWSTVGGGSTSDYSVGSGYGVHTLSTTETSRRTAVTAAHADFDVYADITTSALAAGDSLYGAVTARMLDSSTMYMVRVQFSTTNTVVLSLRKVVADVTTELGTYTVPVTHVAGQFVRVRFQGRGTTLRVKGWLASSAEPSDWRIEVTDAAITAAAQIGTRSIRTASNTNAATVQIRYDNVDVINPQVFTVIRSRNNIVKAQAAGADVRLAYPAIVAL